MVKQYSLDKLKSKEMYYKHTFNFPLGYINGSPFHQDFVVEPKNYNSLDEKKEDNND